MRRTIGSATIIMSTCLLILSARVQAGQGEREDMRSDRNAIHQDRDALRHDRNELRNDLRHGDYEAAAHEQDEMNGRRQDLREERQDLRNDWLNHRAHEDQEPGLRPFHDHHDHDND